MFTLFSSVARAVIDRFCTSDQAGWGDILVGVGEGAWVHWCNKQAEGERQAELQAIVQASANQIRNEVASVVNQIASDKPPEVREQLANYLTQIPATVRHATRRPSDPTGMTLPPYLVLRKAEDLVALLPTRLAKFRAGQQPIPGVDLQVVELLGIGGFGEVWKACNHMLPNMPPVALKFCLDSVAAKSLRNEAALLDHVMRNGKHPGIVQLRHTYLSADPPCLEYEYVEGGDLGGLIEELHSSKGGSAANTSILVEKSRAIMLRLADIVAFAHKAKPASRPEASQRSGQAKGQQACVLRG